MNSLTVLASAIATFAALLAAGVVVEIYTARTGMLLPARAGLNRVIGRVLARPAAMWSMFQDWHERSYHPTRNNEGSPVMKWVIRAHVLIVIPLATYLVAEQFEALAVATRPIAGIYMSPTEAWYFGAAGGFVTAALAPLVLYMGFWAFIGIPTAIVSFLARRIQRLIINTTDSASGLEQAPFAITGAALGLAAAGGMIFMGT